MMLGIWEGFFFNPLYSGFLRRCKMECTWETNLQFLHVLSCESCSSRESFQWHLLFLKQKVWEARHWVSLWVRGEIRFLTRMIKIYLSRAKDGRFARAPIKKMGNFLNSGILNCVTQPYWAEHTASIRAQLCITPLDVKGKDSPL